MSPSFPQSPGREVRLPGLPRVAVSENAISGLSLSAEARLLAARHLSLATVYCLSAMLKITVAKSPKSTTLRVEGRLTGPWVDELERAGAASRRSHRRPRRRGPYRRHLRGRGREEATGNDVRERAKLIASGCVTRRLVEDIELSSIGFAPGKAFPFPSDAPFRLGQFGR